MAEVKKARLFLRRGTDTDRKTTTLCQGELGYSTDAFRVFVGDGSTAGGRIVGNYLYVSAGANSAHFHTNLTTASANGRAHKGDIAIFPAQSYKKADGSTTVTPHTSASTVMILTADVTAGGSEAATPSSWVAVNSGIPFGNIDVFDDDISGNYVSGGVISAPITLSGGPIKIGGDGETETLTLSGVALSAATVPTGDLIYPLGLTSTSQLTCVGSIFDFGAPTNTTGLGNAGGYLHASTTNAASAVSAFAISSSIYTFGGATGSALVSGSITDAGTGSGIDVFTSAGYLGSGGAHADGTGNVFLPAGYTYTGGISQKCAIKEFVWGIAEIRKAVQTASLTWAQIQEFYFSVFHKHYDDSATFVGHYNSLTNSNEIVHWNGSSVSDGKMRQVPDTATITIPNTYNGSVAATKRLVVHLGIAAEGQVGITLTGLRVNVG